MRWVYWLLGIAGVLQHAIMAVVKPAGYVSLDTSYLVMWLSLIGAGLAGVLSCGYGGGCGCCGDGCSCGDCDECRGDGHGHATMAGHEGHDHPH